MGEGAARKRSKHGFAFDERTVIENSKVKNAHMSKDVFGMNVCKGASVKITAVKLLVRKIYILKDKTAGTKSDNLFVGCYVVVNVLLDFSRVRNMVEAVTFFFRKIALLIKGRKRIVTAVSYKTWVFCKHNTFIL